MQFNILASFSKDETYLDGSKEIDHIFLSPSLADVALKAGHHKFHQHFISDHRGIYIHFKVKDLFDMSTFDTTPFAYRELKMEDRDKVEKYIEYLEQIYEDNKFKERLSLLVSNIRESKEGDGRQKLLQKLDKMDQERTQYMRVAEKS